MTLQDLYQTYLDASPKEQIEAAINASAVVLSYLNKKADTEKAAATYLMLIATYVGADGNVQAAEYKFCKAVFGFDFSFDEFFKMVNAVMSDETIEFIDSVIDSAPIEVKSNFVALGVAICSCNGTMTASEQRLLKKYLD